jgi:hypothetical protein
MCSRDELEQAKAATSSTHATGPIPSRGSPSDIYQDSKSTLDYLPVRAVPSTASSPSPDVDTGQLESYEGNC